MAKGKTHSNTWKAFEMRVARALGSERYSKTRLGDTVPDVVTKVDFSRNVVLCIECKLRAQLSKFVIGALKEAEGYAADETKLPDWIRQVLDIGRELVRRGGRERLEVPVIPMAILKEKHAPDNDSLVVMRFGSLRKLVDIK